MNLSKILNASKRELKKSSPTILTVLGVLGVASTSFITAKNTIKAVQIWNDLKLKTIEEHGEEPTKTEYFKASFKCYIPAIIMGVSTIICITSSNVLNKRSQAALSSAYVLLDRSYREYRDKVNKIFGENADSQVQKDIMEEILANSDKEFDPDLILSDNKLFYEQCSGQYFESSLEEVLRAEYSINRCFIINEYAKLNDFLTLLGLEKTDKGSMVGWSMYMGLEFYGYQWIDFKHEIVTLDDGLECCVISMPFQPTADCVLDDI